MNNFKKNIILAVLCCQLTNNLDAVKKIIVVSDYMGSRWMAPIEFDETQVKTISDFKEAIRRKKQIPEDKEIILTNVNINDKATIKELEKEMEKKDQLQAIKFDVKDKSLKRKRSDSDEKETTKKEESVEPETKKPATESGIVSRIKNWWSKK